MITVDEKAAPLSHFNLRLGLVYSINFLTGFVEAYEVDVMADLRLQALQCVLDLALDQDTPWCEAWHLSVLGYHDKLQDRGLFKLFLLVKLEL